MTTTTIATKAVATDTISQSDYNAIAADINELIGRSGRNLLVNGGMENWTLGAGGFTADLAYTADMWQIDLVGGSTISVNKETTVVDNSKTSMGVAYTHSSASVIQQKLEDYLHLRGKTLALSVRVRCSAAITVSVTIRDSVGATVGSVALAANTYTTITAVRTIDAAATSLTVELNLGASATYYFDNAMLVIGPNATEFVPLSPAEDLARCQRYIEFIGGATNSVYHRGYNTIGLPIGTTVYFKVQKYGTPSLSKVGTWTVANCAQPTVDAPSPTTCRIFSAVTATGDASFATSNATDGILVTSYP